jgi:hypothetical protein
VDLANAIRRHYQSAATKVKREILAEFVAATGCHEKSAIRVLNSQATPRHRQTRGIGLRSTTRLRGTL